MIRRFLTLLAATAVFALPGLTNAAPLRIEITEGVIEPLPFAAPDFVAENSSARQLAQEIAQLVADDLSGTGLFREIPDSAHISTITSFSSPVQYADWKAINAQALVSGAVSLQPGGRLTVKFRLYDVFAGADMGAVGSSPVRRRAGVAWPIRWLMRSTAGSPAKAAISTAGWSTSAKPARKTIGRSGWRSWIMTGPTCNS